MPRDSNGNASLDPVYKAVTGQTIQAVQHNTPLEDIVSMLTGSLPRAGTAPMLASLPMGGFKVTGLGNGTANDDAATYGQVSGLLPVGVILDFVGITVPSGWLLCNGQAISRTTYAALFTVIGGTFGVGDGSTTFNVPDLRGRVAAGKDDMGGVDAGRLSFFGSIVKVLGGTIGAASHILTTGQMPAHGHTGTVDPGGVHDHTVPFGVVPAGGAGGSGVVGAGPSTNTSASGPHQHSFTTNNTGSNEAHPNAQPTMLVNKIIKTGL